MILPLARTRWVRCSGWTLTEWLVVLGMVFVAFYFLAPGLLVRKNRKSPFTQCISNLYQVGTSLEMYKDENNGKLPMQVSTNMGGSKEWCETGTRDMAALVSFLSIADELKNPKVLVCPTSEVKPATHWNDLTSAKITYFLHLLPGDYSKNNLLSGDANLVEDGQPLPLLFTVNPEKSYSLGNRLHTGKKKQPATGCNLTFADGSVKSTPLKQLDTNVKLGFLKAK